MHLKFDTRKIEFASKNYNNSICDKNQLTLHHTASEGTGTGIARYFDSLNKKIAVPLVLNRDGSLDELFDINFWAYHLGVTKKHFTKFKLPYNNKGLNQLTLPIEIINWGWMEEKNGLFYTWTKKQISEMEVIYYSNKFCGYHYFQKYTDQQIERLRSIIIAICNHYEIPFKYDFYSMFRQNKNALGGIPGVYTHVSYRGSEKSDLHPQPELIQMFNSIII